MFNIFIIKYKAFLNFSGDKMEKNYKLRCYIEWFFCGVFIIAGLLGLVRVLLTQDIVSVNNGLGWDGVHYNRLLEFFSTGHFSGEPAEFPFCTRVGSPWILSNFSEYNIGFFELNIVSSILFIGFFLILSFQLWKDNIKALTSVIFITVFIIFAPIKATNFYPVYTDPPFILLITISAIFAFKEKFILASMVCIVSIPFREAAFYILPLILIFLIYKSENKAKSVFFSILIVSIGLLIKSLLPNITHCESQSQLKVALFMLYLFLSEPQRFIAGIAAILMTLGPLIILSSREKVKDFISLPYGSMALFSIPYFSAISIVGGSDVSRIFYSFIPFYGLYIIYCFKRASISGLFFSLMGWAITSQMINKYKQPLSDWPNNDLQGAFSQTPDYAHPAISLIIIAVWMLAYFFSQVSEKYENEIRWK